MQMFLLTQTGITYPLERVPEFWEWLENAGGNGHAKIPVEVYEEIRDGKDDLANWAKQDQISTASFFKRKPMSLWSLT